MRVSTPQGELIIKFAHQIPYETQCRIFKGEEQVAFGHAECSEKDNFNREVGRKVSMSRALLNAKLDKPTRQEIWNMYLTRPRGN